MASSNMLGDTVQIKYELNIVGAVHRLELLIILLFLFCVSFYASINLWFYCFFYYCLVVNETSCVLTILKATKTL